MRAGTLRGLYRAHVWLGVAIGLLLLTLCISGSVAVFRAELALWASGMPSPSDECALPARDAFERLRVMLPEDGQVRRLSLPPLTGGYFELRMVDGRRAAIDACGDAVPTQQAEIAAFIVNFHTRFFAGKTGRGLIGVLGALMLLSILSGVLVHRKLLRQLFTLRRGRGPRLLLSDGHKMLGVWLLPFHLLVAVTGAWLGITTWLPVPGVNDAAALNVPLIAVRHAVTPDEMLNVASQALQGIEPVFIDFPPRSGIVSVRGNLPGYPVQRYAAEVRFDATDGKLLGVHDPRRLEGLLLAQTLMMPLHFGDWTGPVLRWVYFALGLGSAVLIWLGLRLWADRREHAGGVLWPAGGRVRRFVGALSGGAVAVSVLPILFASFVPTIARADGLFVAPLWFATAVLIWCFTGNPTTRA